MMGAGALLVATLALPVAMLDACLSRPVRDRMPALLALAPVPGLAAALLASGGPPLVLDEARFRFTLALDPPGAILLGSAALLWLGAGLYAWSYLGGKPNAGRFAVWWLLTETGSLGVFFAGDLATFYLMFGLLSLAAWGLVIHDGTPGALRAAAIYLILAVLGEICLLMAFALLATATPGETLAIRDVVAWLPQSPWRGLTIALLIAGFGLKMGLLPLHVWLPIAHPTAPMPASAVLSGAIIKAGVIGLIRFLPFDGSLTDWGAILTGIGLASAFYAVAVGITQANPKTVLAYSSVSQMGFVAAVVGAGLRSGGGVSLTTAFYAAHHVLAKGALFLAVGVVAATGARSLWPVLLPATVLALGFGGLPLTGGGLAKLAVKPAFGSGTVGLLATLAGTGSTLLMLHFVHRLRSRAASEPEATAPVGLIAPWLTLAFAAVALPWALFVTTGIGALADVLAPAALWKALWPVLLGVALSFGLRRWEDRLPRVPEGDLVALVERLGRGRLPFGDAMERAEAVLRRWPVAGLSLLALLAILGAAIAGGLG
jgi:formate hydrogenlyase subunit 3/multisubunit Na+/H+ antiporter MnhD subunit